MLIVIVWKQGSGTRAVVMQILESIEYDKIDILDKLIGFDSSWSVPDACKQGQYPRRYTSVV